MNTKASLTSSVDLRDTLDHNKVVSVLAIGDAKEWTRQGHELPKDNIAFLSFEDVSDAMVEHYSPSIIYSPVLAHAFDCIELALLLRNIGYDGAYRAIAQDLPKPELIEREVSSMCPQLDFQIILQP